MLSLRRTAAITPDVAWLVTAYGLATRSRPRRMVLLAGRRLRRSPDRIVPRLQHTAAGDVLFTSKGVGFKVTTFGAALFGAPLALHGIDAARFAKGLAARRPPPPLAYPASARPPRRPTGFSGR